MRLSEKKYYNTYKIRRNENGNIYDLIFMKSYETLEGKKASFKNNLNDSKLVVDLDDIKTYTDGNGDELASFIDYETERVNNDVVIIDRIKNKVLSNQKPADVLDYITAHVNGTYNNVYVYNNNSIVVLR